MLLTRAHSPSSQAPTGNKRPLSSMFTSRSPNHTTHTINPTTSLRHIFIFLFSTALLCGHPSVALPPGCPFPNDNFVNFAVSMGARGAVDVITQEYLPLSPSLSLNISLTGCVQVNGTLNATLSICRPQLINTTNATAVSLLAAQNISSFPTYTMITNCTPPRSITFRARSPVYITTRDILGAGNALTEDMYFILNSTLYDNTTQAFVMQTNNISLLYCPSNPTHPHCVQRATLVALRNASLTSLSNVWMLNTSVCSWLWVSCVNGNVVALNLPNRISLSPNTTLPSLSPLTALTLLNLATNALSQPLTTLGIEALNLSIVLLNNNNFSGPLASYASLFEYPFLTTLNLSNNALSGPIPSFATAPSPLFTRLDLSNNYLTGSVPPMGPVTIVQLKQRSGVWFSCPITISGNIPNISSDINASSTCTCGAVPSLANTANASRTEALRGEFVIHTCALNFATPNATAFVNQTCCKCKIK